MYSTARQSSPFSFEFWQDSERRDLPGAAGSLALEMEGTEELGLVLSRASELRSKIDRRVLENVAERRLKEWGEHVERKEVHEDGDDAEWQEESLIELRDVLESLEQELSSLQALEQQQIYEKEAALAQIDRRRLFLLRKIRDHEGDSELLQELANFAGGNVEGDVNGDGGGDLLHLPPYSSLMPEAFISSSLHLHKNHKRPLYDRSSSMENQKKSTESLARSLARGAGWVFGFVAKSTAGIVGALALARIAGYEPRLARKGERPEPLLEPSVRCPAGRVILVHNGVAQCVVKERVEVPFESVESGPLVDLGLG